MDAVTENLGLFVDGFLTLAEHLPRGAGRLAAARRAHRRLPGVTRAAAARLRRVLGDHVPQHARCRWCCSSAPSACRSSGSTGASTSSACSGWSSTRPPSSARRCAPASTRSRPARRRPPARSGSNFSQGAALRRPPAGAAHRGAAAGQRHHRDVQELGGRRRLRRGRRPVEHRRRRSPAPAASRPCRCSSASRSATSPSRCRPGRCCRSSSGRWRSPDEPARRCSTTPRDRRARRRTAIGTAIAVRRPRRVWATSSSGELAERGPVHDGEVGPADRPRRRVVRRGLAADRRWAS